LGTIQELTGDSDEAMQANLTPYRVIADHARAAAFLIADGVVPGNIGRNYVCRMIVRRASRFGGKIGLDEPFMARVAQAVIDHYGGFFSELKDNEEAIRQTLSEEERRFQRTLQSGIAHLTNVIQQTQQTGTNVISGADAVDLYTTHGLPFELTRDIAREHDLEVDEAGFTTKMEEHRLASGAGQDSAVEADLDPEPYLETLAELKESGGLPQGRVEGDPYSGLESEGPVLAIIAEGSSIKEAKEGQIVDMVLPLTHFYVEAGGQVADSGTIVSVKEPRWEIDIEQAFEPVGGLIVHRGRVTKGQPRIGDLALTAVQRDRRWDIMRNHTATHLLQAALRQVLGGSARQSGSLVAPDRFRFDFSHNQPMTADEIQHVERLVNESILANYPLEFLHKPLEEAKKEGAIALFGETYGETVRTVRIGHEQRISYELCGGTHVPETGVIGMFLITSEGSVAAGVRRIEAVTGRGAYELIHKRLQELRQSASVLGVSQDQLSQRVESLLAERADLLESIERMLQGSAQAVFDELTPIEVKGASVLSGQVPASDAETLRQFSDQFRSENSSSVVVLGSVLEDRPVLIAAVSDDLIEKGLHAGELVKFVAGQIGGGGGGKANMAQAGGKDPSKLPAALDSVADWVKERLG
jgi:alanyl-tRNA synthetase